MSVEVFFRIGDVEEAAILTRKYHYSRRPAATVQVVGTWCLAGGLFGDRGETVAACVFSLPPARWSEEVWELSRLVRVEGMKLPPLSGLIASTVRFIAANRLAHLLVSYADCTQSHHGGIYQAASWNYAGLRKRRMDGVIIDGVYRPSRTCSSVYGTHSIEKLRLMMPWRSFEPHYDKGKHLYWRALTKEGKRRAKRLGLETLDYPKPDRCEEIAALIDNVSEKMP